MEIFFIFFNIWPWKNSKEENKNLSLEYLPQRTKYLEMFPCSSVLMTNMYTSLPLRIACRAFIYAQRAGMLCGDRNDNRKDQILILLNFDVTFFRNFRLITWNQLYFSSFAFVISWIRSYKSHDTKALSTPTILLCFILRNPSKLEYLTSLNKNYLNFRRGIVCAI